MKLPNAQNAVIDNEKLTGYCLNPKHPKGKHKARRFEQSLCIKNDDAVILQQALQKAVLICEAIEQTRTAYGRIFRIDFSAGRGLGIIWHQTTLRSAWIIRNDEDFPRLITCYNPS